MYREWMKIVFPKEYIYMNFGTRLRGRPRNRWQDEAREDRRRWEEKVQDREEWQKLQRMTRNRHILHMPMIDSLIYLCLV
jgi:hypothetical protein